MFHPTRQSQEVFVPNQINIETVSRAALGKLMSDGREQVWAFPSAAVPF